MAQQPILIRVDDSESQITGTIEAAGEAPVNISLDAPVFGGDGALEAAILGMELEEGFSAPVRIAEIAPLQRVRYFTVAVAGREDIDVPAGEFNVGKVELTAEDGEGGDLALWVGTDTLRVLRTRDDA